MTGSPLRFQLVVAVLAVSGVLLVTDGQGKPAPQPVFAFQDRSIDESSGLVDVGTHVLTVNDSGADPVVYVIDPSTGETVGRTTFTDDEVVDVEALAPGPGDTLWVGDIGDNPWQRSSVAVYELPTPGVGDTSVDARRYDLVYEGGPRDAEALLVHPGTGRLYVVSKGLFGGKVYEAPARLSSERPNVLHPVADVSGLVTDGAFFPDGRFVALRSYSNLTVLAVEGWRNVGGATLPDQDQGEGLAVRPSGRQVLVSTEGAGSEVLEVPLSPAILDAIAPPDPTPAESARPDPSETVEPARPDPSDGGDGVDPWQVAGLAAVTLAAALGVRALFRRRRWRS